MTIYKVGGCIRDHIMGVESRDVDFVVTNSSVKEMLAMGFKIVGNEFPVFLHPQTGEEYALARTERKTGVGYNGFEFNTEDLNPELKKKFIELGYDPEEEYDIDELIKVFRNITQ